ncbi:putative ubiquitin-activating enzyme [Helianthus anomalus]
MQFCKNIVLAGVGSLTLNNNNPVTEEAFAANFLIPFDVNMGGRGSLAELCCDSLKDFNPTVHFSVEKGDLSSFDVDFFEKLDVDYKDKVVQLWMQSYCSVEGTQIKMSEEDYLVVRQC